VWKNEKKAGKNSKKNLLGFFRSKTLKNVILRFEGFDLKNRKILSFCPLFFRFSTLCVVFTSFCELFEIINLNAVWTWNYFSTRGVDEKPSVSHTRLASSVGTFFFTRSVFYGVYFWYAKCRRLFVHARGLKCIYK